MQKDFPLENTRKTNTDLRSSLAVIWNFIYCCTVNFNYAQIDSQTVLPEIFLCDLSRIVSNKKLKFMNIQ